MGKRRDELWVGEGVGTKKREEGKQGVLARE